MTADDRLVLFGYAKMAGIPIEDILLAGEMGTLSEELGVEGGKRLTALPGLTIILTTEAVLKAT